MKGAIAREELHGDEGILMEGHDIRISGAKTAGWDTEREKRG